MRQSIWRHASSSGLPFTQICNTLPRAKISIEAKGLMLSILSLPLDWKFNRKWAMNELDVGEDKLKRVMDELVDAGYCRMKQERSKGGAFSEISYSFTDVPHEFGDEEKSAPEAVSTASGFSRSRQNPVHTKKDSYKETKKITPLPPVQASAPQAGLALAPGSNGDVFLNGKEKPAATVIAFARALEQTEAEQPTDTLEGNPSLEICTAEPDTRFGGWSLEQIEKAAEVQAKAAIETPSAPEAPKAKAKRAPKKAAKAGAMEAFMKFMEQYPEYPEKKEHLEQLNKSGQSAIKKAFSMFSKYNEDMWPTIIYEAAALDKKMHAANDKKLGKEYAKFAWRPLRFLTDMGTNLMERHAELVVAEQRKAEVLQAQQEAERLAALAKAKALEEDAECHRRLMEKKRKVIEAVKIYVGDRFDEFMDKVDLCRKIGISRGEEKWKQYLATLSSDFRESVSDWAAVRWYVRREAFA